MTQISIAPSSATEAGVAPPNPREIKLLFREFLDSLGFEATSGTHHRATNWQPQAGLSLEGY